jgi:hypothetical protein
LAVGEHTALGGVQAEGRGNLDSLAGCGIIGTHVLCTIEAVQLALGGLTFCVPGLSPRRVLAVKQESKTGAAQDELGTAPVFGVLVDMKLGDWFRSAAVSVYSQRP